jgi:hypothetical protein
MTERRRPAPQAMPSTPSMAAAPAQEPRRLPIVNG